MKKKLFYKSIVSLCAVFMLITALFCVEAAAGELKYVSGASTGAVYLRKSPASSSYYTIIYNGTAVESIGWARGWDGVGYNQVVYNGQSGWITSRYLSSYYTGSGSTYSAAVIRGASTGAVYRWSSAYGDGYYGTVSVGSKVYVNWSSACNGRVYGTYNGNGGWFTSRYVYSY